MTSQNSSMPANAAFPHTVAEIVFSALDAFLAAARMNLGFADAKGQTMDTPDPVEAWVALMSASALLMQLQPVLPADVRAPYEAELAELTQHFGTAHADVQVPVPGLAVLQTRA
ncbi:MAG TPA: hypothetical protein V6D47_12125 [Oscillatoriaceae cyanobacterium]